MTDIEFHMLEVACARTDSFSPWFIHAEDFLGDLNKKEFRILDKNGDLAFMVTGGSLEYASYICMLHNQFLKEKRIVDQI